MPFKKKWKNDSGTKTYYAWRSMRSRCLNRGNASWDNYGGIGITVCDRWLNDFDAFVEDMGHASLGESLDRIDPTKGYSPENCRWATSAQQARNKRTSRLIHHCGVTLNVVDWAKRLGISSDTLFKRLERMSVSRALSNGLFKDSWQHGTRTSYERKGCRCAECRAFNASRHRQARLSRKLKELSDAG